MSTFLALIPKNFHEFNAIKSAFLTKGFEISDPIGKGGTSDVFKARRAKDGRMVALKLLCPADASDGGHRKLFEREVKLLHDLHHTHIVKLFNAGQLKCDAHGATVTVFYLALELGDTDLQTLLDQQGPLAAREAVTTILSLADAVAYAHAHAPPVLHLDIKPANVIRVANEWKLTDFNIARLAAPDGFGTRSFRAPEVIRARQSQLGPGSDVFGLAATLYTALSGNCIDERRIVRGETPLAADRTLARIPPDLLRIVRAGLHPDARWRYCSAADMSRDLRSWLRGESIQPPVEPAWSYWARRARRHSLATVLVALLALLASVIGLNARRRDVEQQFQQHKTRSAEEVTNLKTEVQGRETEVATLKTTVRSKEHEAEQARGEQHETKQKLETTIAEASPGLAKVYYDKGRLLCEDGDIGPGMLWFVEAWRAASATKNREWERFLRLNLSAWRHRLKFRIKAVIPTGGVAFISPDCSNITSRHGLGFRTWSTESGEPIEEPTPHNLGTSPVTREKPARLSTSPNTSHTRPLPAIALPASKPKGLTRVIEVSEDENTIILAGPDVAQVWSRTKGKPLGPEMPHPGLRRALFTFEGGPILTGGDDGVKLWSPKTFKSIGSPLKHTASVWSLLYNHADRLIISRDLNGVLKTWKIDNQALVDEERISVWSSQLDDRELFAPDGKTLITEKQNDYRIYVWSVSVPGKAAVPDRGQVASLSGPSNIMSPAGDVVLLRDPTGQLELWATHTRLNRVAVMKGTDAKHPPVFSSDGKTLASYVSKERSPANLTQLELWTVPDGKKIGRSLDHHGVISSVRFAPGGAVLGAVSRGWGSRPNGLANGQVRAHLWSTATGTAIGSPMANSSLGRVEFSPDGLLAVTADDGAINMWSTRTGKHSGATIVHPGVRAVGFSPNGKTLLSAANGVVRLWSAETGAPVGQPIPMPSPAPRGGRYDGEFWKWLFSPTGALLLTTSRDNCSFELWDTSSATRVGDTMRINSNGAYDAVVGDGTFLDSEKLLAVLAQGELHCWLTATGQPAGKPIRIAQGAVFSPDGRILATPTLENRVRLYSLESFDEIGPPITRASRVVGFNTENTLISIIDRGTRLFSVPLRLPIGGAIKRAPYGIEPIRFVDDSSVEFAESRGDEVHFWNLDEIPDDVERCGAWVEVVTGQALDPEGDFRVLKPDVWLERRRRLDELGGPL